MLTIKVWPISEKPAEKTATFWKMKDSTGLELSKSIPLTLKNLKNHGRRLSAKLKWTF